MGFLSVRTSGSLTRAFSWFVLSSFDVECQVSRPGVVDQQIKDSTVFGVLLFGYSLSFLFFFFFLSFFVFFFLVIDIFCFLGLGFFAVVLGFCFVF